MLNYCIQNISIYRILHFIKSTSLNFEFAIVQVGIVICVYIGDHLVIFCITVGIGKCFESLQLNFFIDNVEIVNASWIKQQHMVSNCP